MEPDEVFLAALTARFGGEGLRVGMPPEPIATFPAKHPDVGDLKVWAPTPTHGSIAPWLGAQVAVGRLLHDSFDNFDTHLPLDERLARITRDVVRFIDKLFADRLLFWEGVDDGRGWRECESPESLEPLVSDNGRYRPYLWSGPRPLWQAVPAILDRARLRDDREYELLLMQLRDGALEDPDRRRARRLVEMYERERDGSP